MKSSGALEMFAFKLDFYALIVLTETLISNINLKKKDYLNCRQVLSVNNKLIF